MTVFCPACQIAAPRGISTPLTKSCLVTPAAAVAEIVSLCEYLTEHPEVSHKEIFVAFTPDEEIGRGADHFTLEGFGAPVAYTVDGGTLGEIE